MLYDWQFAENFGSVHLDHALVDLVPCLHGRDVVEHGRVPSEGGCLDRVDELNAGEVHIVLRKLFRRVGIVDGLGPDVLVA